MIFFQIAFPSFWSFLLIIAYVMFYPAPLPTLAAEFNSAPIPEVLPSMPVRPTTPGSSMSISLPHSTVTALACDFLFYFTLLWLAIIFILWFLKFCFTWFRFFDVHRLFYKTFLISVTRRFTLIALFVKVSLSLYR